MARALKGEFTSGSKKCYLDYKSLNPDTPITLNQYYHIITRYHELIFEYALVTGNEVKLPYGFGPIQVVKWKPKKVVKDPKGGEHINLAIDWAKTKEKGKYVYHINAHTDGYRFKWRWAPALSRIENADIYLFKPCRKMSRMLAKYLKDPKYHPIYRDRRPPHKDKKRR
jgi:hypothetical protein